MLEIRPQQLQAFQARASAQFAEEIAARCAALAPQRRALLDPGRWAAAAREAVADAARWGLDRRGPVRSYAEWQVLLGAGFLSDPLLGWAASALGPEDDSPLVRADRLHEAALDHLLTVDGEDGRFRQSACAALGALCSRGLPWRDEPRTGELVQAMHHLHPRKAERAGQDLLTAFVQRAWPATAGALPTPDGRGRALVVLMQFLFGHRVMEDGWWPWRSELAPLRGMDRPAPADQPTPFERLCAAQMARLATAAEVTP